MKYFIDTEFIERPNRPGVTATIQLISLGIVAENGDTFYAENMSFDPKLLTPWLEENVVPHLRWWQRAGMNRGMYVDNDGAHRECYACPTQIRDDLLEFIPPESRPEFYGWYSAYDWVVFCWLFGTMMDLPDGYPMYCVDIKQLYSVDGGHRPKVEKPEDAHDALADAHYHKALYDGWQRVVAKRKGGK